MCAKAQRIAEPAKRLTPAQRRVVSNAFVHSFVRASGGYGGAGGTAAQGFEPACVIDRLVAAGLLVGGPWSNTYALSPEGLKRRQAMRAGAPA